ncbi:MAG TPA: sigma-70 family RNA polymerase sigma factor [Fimbriimonadaceae bacterium]|nr:sigma-70 family RNA polymerase sigma factor [Fimbriimonadaceae bacterium]
MQHWEQERWDRLQRGDRDAMAELVRETSAVLYRIAARLTENPEDAEDAVAETYLAAMKTLPRFERRASLKTWLIRILVRQARRRPSQRATSLDASWPAAEIDLCGNLVLAEALERLAPKLKEALILVKVGGLSYREAGEALKVPMGTVQFRVFEATRQLRKRLERPSPSVCEPEICEAEA